MTKPLYAIHNEIRAILESPDELTDSDWEKVQGLMLESSQKAINVALFIREQEALAEVIREEEKRLKARRDALTAKAERLREYLCFFLDTPVKSPTVSIGKGSKTSAEVTDVHALPLRFREEKITWTPRKELILSELERNEVIPGAQLKTTHFITIR